MMEKWPIESRPHRRELIAGLGVGRMTEAVLDGYRITEIMRGRIQAEVIGWGVVAIGGEVCGREGAAKSPESREIRPTSVG
jgi:hypothetical protein